MSNLPSFSLQGDFLTEERRQRHSYDANLLTPDMGRSSLNTAFGFSNQSSQTSAKATNMTNGDENTSTPTSKRSLLSQMIGNCDRNVAGNDVRGKLTSEGQNYLRWQSSPDSPSMNLRSTPTQINPDISMEINEGNQSTVNGYNNRLTPDIPPSSMQTPNHDNDNNNSAEVGNTGLEAYSELAFMNLQGNSLLSSPSALAVSPTPGFNDTTNSLNEPSGDIDRLSVYSNSSFCSNSSTSSIMLPLDSHGYKHIANLDDLDLLLNDIDLTGTTLDVNFDQPNFLDISPPINRTMSAIPVISIQDFNGPDREQKVQPATVVHEQGNRGRSLSQPVVKVEDVDYGSLGVVDFGDFNGVNNSNDLMGFNLFPNEPKPGQSGTEGVRPIPQDILGSTVAKMEAKTDYFTPQPKATSLTADSNAAFLQLPASFDERMFYGVDDTGVTSDVNSVASDDVNADTDTGERYEIAQVRRRRSKSRIGQKYVGMSTRPSVEHRRRSPSPHLDVRRRGNSLGGGHYFPLDSPFDEKARSITSNRDKLLEMADLSPNDKMHSHKNIGVDEGPHRVESSYVCKMCGKAFSRPYNLKSHLRTHTNERPYSCSICGKAFARQHDRRRHEDLHSGKKRYVCGGVLKNGQKWGCGKKFARSDALGRHFKTDCGRRCIAPLYEEAAMEAAGHP